MKKSHTSLIRSLLMLGALLAAMPLTSKAQSDIECTDPETEDGITCVGCWDNDSGCVGAGCTDGSITVIIVECPAT